MSLLVDQPFRSLYLLLSVSVACCQLPFWLIFYLSPDLRPLKTWSYRQAVSCIMMKCLLKIIITFEVKTPLHLEPGAEKERFVVIQPAKWSLYNGAAIDAEIKPLKIGGTWYPALYNDTISAAESGMVVLHFHGGAYVLGDGRAQSCGYLATTLLSHTSCTHIFCPDYRLASIAGGHFPAPLQDAITSYNYLTQALHIPASRIVLSGDSAGGHLALSLLRYLTEINDAKLLPPPRCVWLFSPWCDIRAALDPKHLSRNQNYRTDYVPASLVTWGARQYLGGKERSHVVETYATLSSQPFLLPSPLLVLAGGKEILYGEIKELVTKFAQVEGNEPKVELYVEDTAPHDVLLLGTRLGFLEEAKRSAAKAGEFAKRFDTFPKVPT